MTPRTVSDAEALGEDIRDGVLWPDDVAGDAADEHRPAAPGPLWGDAYACAWPRSGGGGTCSHHAPDECDDCNGVNAEYRDLDRLPYAARTALAVENLRRTGVLPALTPTGATS